MSPVSVIATRRGAGGIPADSPRVEAVQRMRGLVAAGEFDSAFDLGERLMASRPPAEVIEALMYPLDRGFATAPDSGLYDLLQALVRRPTARHRPWRILLTTVLLDRLHWSSEALQESERLLGLPRRYSWMRWHRGMMLLNNRWDFAEAATEFQAVLRGAPQYWKARALLAEIALSQGRSREAFAAMGGLYRTVPEMDRPAILVWRAEMRLWTGAYAAALRDLDAALALAAATRASPFPLTLCWRGAALLKLGRLPEALRDLDAQLRLHPEDQEALIWRGEAKRLAGRCREALADLDAACRFGNSPMWAYVNRALVRARLRDHPGMWADYFLVPLRVRSYFSWRAGRDVKPGAPPRAVTAQLEAILDAGRGVRRSEQYLFSMWLKPLARTVPRRYSQASTRMDPGATPRPASSSEKARIITGGPDR